MAIDINERVMWSDAEVEDILDRIEAHGRRRELGRLVQELRDANRRLEVLLDRIERDLDRGQS